MKVEFAFKRCWRRAGGISIGVNYHFPTGMIDAPDQRYTYRSLVIGLVAWQITVGIITKGRRYTFT
jgi:hypothetical protein